MAGTSASVLNQTITMKREYRETMEVRHRICPTTYGFRGSHQLVDRTDYRVTITWNRGVNIGGDQLWFTLRIVDKSHAEKDSLEVAFACSPNQEPRRENCYNDENTGNYYSQFSCLHGHNDRNPLDIVLRITKVRSLAEGRVVLSDEEMYLHPKKIMTDLYGSLQTTGDITIVAMNEIEFKAHKLILENQSPVFKAMLEADMEESQESKIKMETFEMELVQGMIEFMYLGWTDVIHLAPKGLVKIAHRYQLLELLEASWNSLIKTLNVENCVELLLLAAEMGDQEGTYKKKAGRFIVDNFRDLRGTEEYAALVRDHAGLYLEICKIEEI